MLAMNGWMTTSPQFTTYLLKNCSYKPESGYLIPYCTNIHPTNATLENYTDKLRKHIHLQSTTGTPSQQFDHLPTSQITDLITISYSVAVKKNLHNQSKTTKSPKKKKARNSNAVSTVTGYSQETIQMSMTATTTTDLKQDLLKIIHDKAKQMIQNGIHPLHSKTKSKPSHRT